MMQKVLTLKCQFVDNLWRRSCGLKELPTIADKPKRVPHLESLKESEWVPEFEKLMRNRMVMGAMRYGLLNEQNFEGYDLCGEIIKRTKKFEQDGNLEHLVDVGNIAMIAFFDGKSNGKTMIAQDDSEHAEYQQN